MLGYRSTLLFELRAECVTEPVNRVLVLCVVDQQCVDKLLGGVVLDLDRHDCFWMDEAAVFEINHQAMVSEESITEQRYAGLRQRKFPLAGASIQLYCPGGGAVPCD